MASAETFSCKFTVLRCISFFTINNKIYDFFPLDFFYKIIYYYNYYNITGKIVTYVFPLKNTHLWIYMALETHTCVFLIVNMNICHYLMRKFFNSKIFELRGLIIWRDINFVLEIRTHTLGFLSMTELKSGYSIILYLPVQVRFFLFNFQGKKYFCVNNADSVY